MVCTQTNAQHQPARTRVEFECACFLILLGSKAYSQNTALMTATLSNILTMVVSSAPQFAFSSPSHYSSGVDATGAGTILVSSNFPYDIDVSAAGVNLVESISLNVIPVSEFNIDVTGDGGQSIASQSLSTSATKIVDEGTAGIAQLLNLSYHANGGSNFLNKAAGSYVQTLTFSITVD